MKQYIPGIVGVGLIVISVVVMAVMGLIIKDTIGAMQGLVRYICVSPCLTLIRNFIFLEVVRYEIEKYRVV